MATGAAKDEISEIFGPARSAFTRQKAKLAQKGDITEDKGTHLRSFSRNDHSLRLYDVAFTC